MSSIIENSIKCKIKYKMNDNWKAQDKWDKNFLIQFEWIYR